MSALKLERKSADFIATHERIRPLRDQILIRVLPFEWSDTLVSTYHGAAVRGEVIATGPGRYPNKIKSGRKDGKEYRTIEECRHFRATEVKPGDIVELGGLEIGGYAFTRIQVGGEDHIICSEQDVAILHMRN